MMLHPCNGVAVDAVDYNAWQWVMWLEEFEEGSELEKVRTARSPKLHRSTLHHELQPDPRATAAKVISHSPQGHVGPAGSLSASRKVCCMSQ